MNPSKKVLVAGHICLDITPVFPEGPETDLTRALAPGKLVHVGRPDLHLGGAVANTGLAMRIFGADVRLAGKIGDDDFGQLVRRNLEGYGCSAQLNVDPRADTSYTVVIAAPGSDRVFLHNPGANDTFGADDVSEEMLSGVGHFHFGYPPLMRRMAENDGAELERLFRKVKAKGVTTSLDMAAVDPRSPMGRIDWRRVIARVLPFTDFFVPSIEELGFMLDRRRYEEWNARAEGVDITEILSIDGDIRPLADELVKMGAAVALIKCGARGIYYRSGDSEAVRALCQTRGLSFADWRGRDGFEKSYVPERVVSAAGAGDTCIAAFLAAMLRACPMEDCVRLAAAAGASCVATYDALSGLGPLEELQRRIDGGWKKVSE